MSTGLMIDSKNELKEIRSRFFPKQPVALRLFANIVSYIFHPVFVPLYVIYFIAFVHPYMYSGFPDRVKYTAVMGASFMAFTFFPLVTVLLLKGLNFIDSIFLKTQKDRVIPFIACMIWYFYLWYVWNNFGKTRDAVDMPAEAVQFAFAVFFSTIVGLMANISIKISLHGISMGIVTTFFVLMAIAQPLNFGVYLAVVFGITGLVCTARFIISDHTPQEVYLGLVAGAVSMLIADFVF